MKVRLLSAVLAFSMALWFSGCGSSSSGDWVNNAGGVATSRDDALVYAVDTDAETLFAVDAKTLATVSSVKVGKQPEKVLVGRDDTIFVANRGSRSISVIPRGASAVSAEVKVGVEPVALSLSADGKTLFVLNGTSLRSPDVGSLMAVDLSTLTVAWELEVGEEPRGLALLSGGKRAMVSLLKQGDVVTVDLEGRRLERSGSTIYQQLNAAVLSGQFSTGGFGGGPGPVDLPGKFLPSTFRPRGLSSLAVSPDGKQVYASAQLSSEASLGGLTNGFDPSGGAAYGGGSCGAGSVAAPALLTFTESGDPQVDDATNCGSTDGSDRPPMVLTSNVPSVPIQGPGASVVDPTGKYLFITNHASDTVSVVTTSRSALAVNSNTKGGSGFDSPVPPDSRGGSTGVGTVRDNIYVGAGPTGVALTHDGARAFVYAGFDHTLSVIESRDGVVQRTAHTQLTGDVLSPDAVKGRQLFFSATDIRMTSAATAIACASCHLEGREDGHVWNFPEGPRQTPSLSGRMLAKTRPFHWNGEFSSLGDFMNVTVKTRMGGATVTPAMEQQMAAYLEVAPTPDSPFHGAALSPAQQRGQAVFTKAQCGTCHTGEALTDNGFADVGTAVISGALLDDVTKLNAGRFNTPSLLGISRTAPYLHDGSAHTLKERIVAGKDTDKHGLTKELSVAEVDDLVAYLQTL
jgi:YVTN family beta-propeller protein